jgi:hypothetical protein
MNISKEKYIKTKKEEEKLADKIKWKKDWWYRYLSALEVVNGKKYNKEIFIYRCMM